MGDVARIWGRYQEFGEVDIPGSDFKFYLIIRRPTYRTINCSGFLNLKAVKRKAVICAVEVEGDFKCINDYLR